MLVLFDVRCLLVVVYSGVLIGCCLLLGVCWLCCVSLFVVWRLLFVVSLLFVICGLVGVRCLLWLCVV